MKNTNSTNQYPKFPNYNFDQQLHNGSSSLSPSSLYSDGDSLLMSGNMDALETPFTPRDSSSGAVTTPMNESQYNNYLHNYNHGAPKKLQKFSNHDYYSQSQIVDYPARSTKTSYTSLSNQAVEPGTDTNAYKHTSLSQATDTHNGLNLDNLITTDQMLFSVDTLQQDKFQACNYNLKQPANNFHEAPVKGRRGFGVTANTCVQSRNKAKLLFPFLTFEKLLTIYYF